MVKMNDIIGVDKSTEGIIGKFFYYSIAGILVPRQEFENVGMALGLHKFKPAKASKSGAYRTATTAIKDKVTVKDGANKITYQIYCRDNTKEDINRISRQLVKETLGARTNDYTKLANIILIRKPKRYIQKTKYLMWILMLKPIVIRLRNYMKNSVIVILLSR